MAPGPIAGWSNADKVKETLERSKKYVGPALGQQIDALLSPENLAMLLATLVIWAASHFVGVGEIVDVALLLVGAAMLGPAIVDVADNLLKFGKCIDARSEADLETCAKAFAEALTKGGITAIMAILLRRSAKGLQGARAPGVARPSWLQVAKPSGKFGLVPVKPDPQRGTWWSRYPAVADATLPPGAGWTSAFGEIFYSVQGSATEQQLVLLHETVHRFLSPRLGLLRTFRARLGVSAYARSAIVKYLEEALAETYAQLRVIGFKGVFKGIAFPVGPDYVTLSALATEGAAIGTIIVGVERFTVSILSGPPKWAKDAAAPAKPRVIKGPGIDLAGGMSVSVARGSSLSLIAKAQYGDVALWPLIYDLNKDKIGPNPNVVQPGTKLLLLPLETYSASELAEARKRSPTWKSFTR